jgi:hypothetical protein
MRSVWSSPGIVVLLTIHSGPASATSTIVPDNFASIQAAMDSGVDSVLVKDGTYNENLVMSTNVSVLAYVYPGLHNPQIAAPIVRRFTIEDQAHVEGVIQGLRMRGLGSLTLGQGPVTFESCRFDSGVVAGPNGGYWLFFRGCTFIHQCVMQVATWEMTNCTLIGTGLDGRYEGYALVRDNVVIGPAPVGISLAGRDGGLQITGNLVMGTADGISSPYPAGTYISDNEVRNCSGTAYLTSHEGTITFESNRAIACGGRGFDIGQGLSSGLYAFLSNNVVDSVGSDGVLVAPGGTAVSLRGNSLSHVGGNGVVGSSTSFSVSTIANRIIGTGGVGFALASAGLIDSNVIGRAAGNGIVVLGSNPMSHVRSNTVFECGGSGIVAFAHVDSIDHNMSFGNAGYGVSWSASGSPVIGCNDWFGNIAGATSGVTAGPSDLNVNPVFCDLPNNNVHLSAASPLANAAGCGLIGAQGVGCASPLSVGPASASGRLGLMVAPTPSRGRVTFALSGLDAGGVVEVFDLSGARRWQSACGPRQTSLKWSGNDQAGAPVPAGVYYARLASAGLNRTTRIVLVR